jgi:hypothetical protein
MDIRSCNPSNFWREPFDMVLFPFQNLGRDEHGEIRVLNADFFDLSIEPLYPEFVRE